MAKSQTNYATHAANNLIDQAQGLTKQLGDQFQGMLGTAQGRQTDTFNASFGGLQDALKTGGYDPAILETLRGDTQQFAQTGGYDPAALNQIMGGYSDLATTGGFTPEQSQAFMRQATEGTQGTYGALEDQARRASVATGGQGTGGALSQMARQLSQVQGRNTLDAEVALNERQTANKLAGLGGEAGVSSDVAAGRRAGEGMRLGLESGVQQGKLSANQMMNQLYNTTTGQVTDLGNQILKTLGLNFATQEGAINALTQLSKNPGFFQTMIGDIIGLSGAAAGVMGGMGGMGGG